MRAVLLLAGLLLTLAVDFIVGLAAGRVGEEAASAPPRTVTVERTVERTVTVPATTATTTTTMAATATATAAPAEADIVCQIRQECEVGAGTVVIQRAAKTKSLTAQYAQPKSGNFMVVEFTYTYNGNRPGTVFEIPWRLVDGQGRSYQYSSSLTIDYSNTNESILFEDVNPGVSRPGKAIFTVAPDAEDFTLVIVDLVNPQRSEAAEIPL